MIIKTVDKKRVESYHFIDCRKNICPVYNIDHIKFWENGKYTPYELENLTMISVFTELRGDILEENYFLLDGVWIKNNEDVTKGIRDIGKITGEVYSNIINSIILERKIFFCGGEEEK